MWLRRCGAASPSSAHVQGYVAEAEAGSLPTVALARDVYAALQATAAAQGKSNTHLATEALRQYLA